MKFYNLNQIVKLRTTNYIKVLFYSNRYYKLLFLNLLHCVLLYLLKYKYKYNKMVYFLICILSLVYLKFNHKYPFLYSFLLYFCYRVLNWWTSKKLCLLNKKGGILECLLFFGFYVIPRNYSAFLVLLLINLPTLPAERP